VWAQTRGAVTAFVAAAGTGGTLAGTGAYLQSRNPDVKIYLIDPPGSSLYNRVTRGVMYASTEAEGKRSRNQVDTITEGIGINRLTANFARAPPLAGAFRGTDAEAVAMARHLRSAEGLFVGSSSAMNAVGALRVAQALGPGHTVVTVLCDGGGRHLSKFWSEGALEAAGLTPPPERAGHELEWLLSSSDA
jgi:cysteine synthase A